MKVTHSKYRTRRGPRKWRESFTVWIDFIGDRSQVGPLLDFIAGVPSDGGGTFVIGPPLCDQSWTFNGVRNRRAIYISTPIIEARTAAERCFKNLKAACKDRWSPYIRLRLLHDDKPDRCRPVIPAKPVSSKNGRTVFLNPRPGRGPLVLRKYQRGKCPQMPVRKMRTRKKGAA